MFHKNTHHPGMKGCIYILTSQRNGMLCTGVTSDLPPLYERQNDLRRASPAATAVPVRHT
uniref:hypothetical protein n=1 Tax=Rhizobium sp. T1473 TaxID=555321 RepID=UPI00403F6F96